MNWTAGMFVACAGFMAGMVLSSFLVRWLAVVAEAWPQVSGPRAERPSWGRVLLTVASRSLFHSGPWLVVAVAFFAYQVHSKPWAEWLFWGAGVSVFFMATVTIRVAHRIFKRRRQRNAA